MGIMKTLTINGVTFDVVPTVPSSSVTLLASAWGGFKEGKYFQAVNIPGVTPHTKVDLQPSSTQLVEFHDKVLGFVAENDNGLVQVFAIGDKPTDDYTIQVTMIEVEGTGKIRGNTVGTTMPRSDLAQTDPTKADYVKNRHLAMSVPLDTTLTQSGKAADAKVTGDRITQVEGKIPTKPADIGAEPSGTAVETILLHNHEYNAHPQLRYELNGLKELLNEVLDSDDQTLDQFSEIVAYIKSNKTLIDAITTSKVSVVDIIDNLTTNVANRPLSAAMGVALASNINSVRSALANYQPKGNYALVSAIPTKVSQLQNDSGYLTQHQDISGKVDKTGLSLGYHTDGLLYLFVDGQPVGAGIELPTGGISGYVDSENNNIIINNLSDGTYTVKYELEDGSTIEIGDLVLGADDPDVPAPGYTNLAEPNPDNTTDFSIWCSNARLSGDGVVRESDGYTCTNSIALTAEDVIRVRGFKVERLGLYDADKAILPLGASDLAGHAANNYIYGDYSQTDDATTFTIRALTPVYMRLSGWVNSTADAVVITKNEEIT